MVQASIHSGRERVLGFNRANPTAVATDGINVYWTEASGSIFKTPVDGGNITTLAADINGLSGIATDGIEIFWVEGGGTIARMPVDGGRRASSISGRAGMTGRIAVDGASIYWQEGNNILKAPKEGGPISTLTSRTSITGLATDGTHVYLAENLNPGNILRVPVGGGAVSTVISGPFQLNSLAVGAANLAWTSNTGPGAVMTKVKD